MHLTIDQAMQKGVEAHKAGRILEAKRLYHCIIRACSYHPGANHNLGILEMMDNKVDVALPLFKTALEGKPKVEQFWLSYIDAS